MKSLLIMKSEFLCIAILIILFIYAILIKKETVRKEYDRLAATAVFQLTFEYISIALLGVKNKSITVEVINRVVSAVDILLVLFFCYTFLRYISKLVFSTMTAKRIGILGVIPLVIYTFLAPFNDFEYIKGASIYYIGGEYVGLWLSVCIVYIGAVIVILVLNRQRIERQVVIMFEVISLMMIVLLYVQLIVPEMHLLGCTLTLVTIATYLSIENNADSNNYRMSIDIETGVKNKKAYIEDMNKINSRYFKSDSSYETITIVLFDIVGMNVINEKFGLIVGDEIIARTADIISRSLKNVHNIYRIRGDVFAAVYISEDESDIHSKCRLVGTEVARTNRELPFDYYVATAVVSKDNTAIDGIEEIITLADRELDKQKDIIGKKLNA